LLKKKQLGKVFQLAIVSIRQNKDYTVRTNTHAKTKEKESKGIHSLHLVLDPGTRLCFFGAGYLKVPSVNSLRDFHLLIATLLGSICKISPSPTPFFKKQLLGVI